LETSEGKGGGQVMDGKQISSLCGHGITKALGQCRRSGLLDSFKDAAKMQEAFVAVTSTAHEPTNFWLSSLDAIDAKTDAKGQDPYGAVQDISSRFS
jgi:hypothetical protein